MTGTIAAPAATGRSVLIPLALAQFICSFAGSSMNVMINDISADLDTSVQGVQVVITVFLLVMAALMIPGGKLTDRWGRKLCLRVGLVTYGVGALLSAVAPGLGVLIVGNSILEGVGTALLIPPVYILTTLLFTGTAARARAFGTIMALGGVGAAAGPLLGGLLTTAINWRANFGFQVVIVAVIVFLTRKLEDPLPADRTRPFDTVGAVLSAGGLILLVTGILAADNNTWLMIALLLAGAAVLGGFFRWIRRLEDTGREPLLASSLFHNRTSNLGLVTQNAQWLVLMGVSFTVGAYLQVVRGYNAISTGAVFTSATLGLLATSLAAERLAERRSQRSLIITGFALTTVGIVVLLLLVRAVDSVWAFTPGLLLIGLGIGLMLTPSVNIVQSAFPDSRQGEISGLSRSVSNLGSSIGTAVAGTILVSELTRNSYAAAMAALALCGLIGLCAALFLPRDRTSTAPPPAPAGAGEARHST
ncbi:putative MFS family arabinose efflux permease [Streptomyces sp. 1114.5]|uniref:MFS transporter n=1 Tax=unclassified Streptomyces TaxID=2593676 RepID=UPI000BD87847|nr:MULTISPECIES: MFS transporter [unclassified Streptomyces]RKT19497.1 putative MFS family arabinose efflux permease [Streptomyces sp. 1114.5]SOB85693.1 Predicted arabinose efflux permease, MFS family [Streptomyces sp. 1331.2]